MNYPKGLSSLDRDQTIRDAANRNTEKPEVSNPAKEFVSEVNKLFPGTFPPKADMDYEAIMGDIDTFNSEDLAA